MLKFSVANFICLMLNWKGKTEYVVCTLRSTWHSTLKKIYIYNNIGGGGGGGNGVE